MKKIEWTAAGLALWAALAAPTAMTADSDPEAAIAYRQSYMTSVGGHFGALKQLVTGAVTAPGDMPMHAAALAALGKDITALFPAGSDVGETAAKPEIWAQWDDFSAKADAAAEATAALAAAVEGGDRKAIGEGFKAVGQSCRGCHEDYKRRD